MATLTGVASILSGDTSVVDTTKQHQLGTRARDASGNEYIYLQGTGSVAAGDFVYFDGSLVVTRSTAAATGPMGVAAAAVVAHSYGWFQIYGVTPATTNIATDASANGKPLFVSATAGRASTTISGSDSIVGATAYGAAASNAGQAFLNYPYAMNTSYL